MSIETYSVVSHASPVSVLVVVFNMPLSTLTVLNRKVTGECFCPYPLVNRHFNIFFESCQARGGGRLKSSTKVTAKTGTSPSMVAMGPSIFHSSSPTIAHDINPSIIG